MPSTLADRAASPLNRTRVRRVQSNREGGKPVDDLVLGFEGTFEGLVAEIDDHQAIEECIAEARRVGSIQAMTEARITSTRTVSDHDAGILRACRKHLARVLDHAKLRAERLQKVCIPEEQRIASELDARLEDRRLSGTRA
jgi:hypothetical protein